MAVTRLLFGPGCVCNLVPFLSNATAAHARFLLSLDCNQRASTYYITCWWSRFFSVAAAAAFIIFFFTSASFLLVLISIGISFSIALLILLLSLVYLAFFSLLGLLLSSLPSLPSHLLVLPRRVFFRVLQSSAWPFFNAGSHAHCVTGPFR